MFQWNFNGFLEKLKGGFKDVSRMCQGCFKEFTRKLLLHESLECVTRMMFYGRIRSISKKCKGYFKRVSPPLLDQF